MLSTEAINKETLLKKPGFFATPVDQPVESKESITQKDKDTLLKYLKEKHANPTDTFNISEEELNKFFSPSQNEVSFTRTYKTSTFSMTGTRTEIETTEKTIIEDWFFFLQAAIDQHHKNKESKDLFQKIANIKSIDLIIIPRPGVK